MKIARLARRITITAAGSAVALSAVGVCAAQAGIPTNLAIKASAINARPTLNYFAPTDDLSAVANSLTFTSKSTTTDVRAAAGLTLAHPVSISATYRTFNSPSLLHGVGRSYDPANGTNLAWSYPAPNANEFRVRVHITLTEVVSPTDTETFAIDWNPILLPLYDVNISPLTFTLTSLRSIGNDADLFIWWQDSYGAFQNRTVDVVVGHPKPILEFAQSLHEVSALSTVPSRYAGGPLLTNPVPNFYPELFAAYADPEMHVPATHLVTGQGYRYDKTIHESALGGITEWTGRLQFSVTEQLHTYATL
jgi:uncharacterized protein (DUF427 family)